MQEEPKWFTEWCDILRQREPPECPEWYIDDCSEEVTELKNYNPFARRGN